MHPIRIFVTGGTFDKAYNELTGELFFKDSHLPEMLKLGRCNLQVEVRTLMMIDSLQMTDDDRQIILQQCRNVPESRIVIRTGPTPWWRPPRCWRAVSPIKP